MFKHIEKAKADPILGLNEAFHADNRSNKVNLGVGVFKDDAGKTPILECVKEAERRLLDREVSKSYLGIDGDATYNRLVQELMFGQHSSVLKEGRAKTAQSLGGTGALRIAADFLKQRGGSPTIWISDPSWANHQQVFTAAGLSTKSYRYYDGENKNLDFEGLLNDLSQAGENDLILFHACCHNPSGVDPSREQWETLAELALKQKFTVLFDMAYQGFAKGLEEDVFAVRLFAETCPELLIASSFSKNFGLYNERVGAFTLIGETAEQADNAFSQVKTLIRGNYSNPSAHGGLIVSTVLDDETLKDQWINELTGMRVRIQSMRVKLQTALAEAIPDQDYSFINQQNGMFSFSGLSKEQVNALRTTYGIYIVGSGRINVAGITDDNLDYLVSSIANLA